MLNSEVDAAAIALCSELAARPGGVTTCELWMRPLDGDARSIADGVAAKCGFKELGERWIELTRDDAATIAAALLSHDLAYHSELLDGSAARDLAASFVALFHEAYYFTNGDLGMMHAHGGKSASWDPITPATFDTGLIVVGGRRAGILWVQDED